MFWTKFWIKCWNFFEFFPKVSNFRLGGAKFDKFAFQQFRLMQVKLASFLDGIKLHAKFPTRSTLKQKNCIFQLQIFNALSWNMPKTIQTKNSLELKKSKFKTYLSLFLRIALSEKKKNYRYLWVLKFSKLSKNSEISYFITYYVFTQRKLKKCEEKTFTKNFKTPPQKNFPRGVHDI